MSAVSTRSTGARTSDDRVRRTMDVTRSLLLRSGYKRTTMDEIARRADIGKGTIYLSWDTKDDLIRTLVIQEIVGVCQDISRIAMLRPAVAQLSEFSRELFTLVFKYPLFRALYTYDKETIGRACDDPQLDFQCYRFTTFTPFRDYLRMLHESGMWDPSHSFALDALLSGFIKLHLHAEIAGARPDLAAHADSLAGLIRSSFEPADQVPAAELTDPARRTVEIFDGAAAKYRAKLIPQPLAASV
ncbi:helix-turn-helix domain-containing protein [Nonomuraea sp. NPDC049625]|uniref:TetR/AcrR family transcriptional regulator n=1 Tax=Nonomuraea sp. NPDC049625 TaxID=3155775 RepID=UPI0034187ADF